MKIPFMFKQLYRSLHWHFYNLFTLYKARNIVSISPEKLVFGFKGDFSPFYTLRLKKPGDWDKKSIPIEDHIVFRSMKERFILKKEWDQTPHYRSALKRMKAGTISIKSKQALDENFREWDTLYENIRKNGYKSNRELHRDGTNKNILCLLDEITVNITRDGVYLLNSGWHRAIIAKLLDIPEIPVRILVTHSLYKDPEK